MFPRGSKSFFEANDFPVKERAIIRRFRRMNKTEESFTVILEAWKKKDEISRYVYEGITLRWNGVKYTPDFITFPGMNGGDIRLIECKGAFFKGKFERAVERFRHARTFWPEFMFELWQKKQGQWRRLE